jgi:hypothetical protein
LAAKSIGTSTEPGPASFLSLPSIRAVVPASAETAMTVPLSETEQLRPSQRRPE